MADDSYPIKTYFKYVYDVPTESWEEINVVFTTNVEGKEYKDYFDNFFSNTDEDVDSIYESYSSPINFQMIAENFIRVSIEGLVNYLNKNESIFDSYREDVSIDEIIEDWCSPINFGGYFLNSIVEDNLKKNFFIDRYDSIGAIEFDDMIKYSIPEQFSKIIYERRRDYLPSQKNNEFRQIFTSMVENLRNLFVENKNPMQLEMGVEEYASFIYPYTYFTFIGYDVE